MSRKSYPNVNAANQYARDVVRGKIIACQFVIQACQRHLDDLMAEKSKSFRYRFDKDLAERAAKFIQLLPHTKGEWAFKRMPITLEPWQLFVICCAFGWVNKGTRLRRFREVYTEIPRKNGKSAISAGVALYCFACDNEFGAEVYSGATTEKQAWEVFRPARLMCKRTPMLTEAFGIEVNASNMNRPEDGARFEPLIGNPGDGSSPHCAVVDEYHEHATDALYTTMLTGMGARRQPLMWAIKFGAGKNGFTRGNPQTGTPATDLDDDYFDMLQEELCSVVEASGASLEKGRHDQLLTALRALLLSRKNPFGDIKSDGTVQTALENLGLGEGSALPVGIPVPWPSATPPTGWLKCNGAAFSAEEYPELAKAYPTNKLPDLRGEFIRGWDDGRGIDTGRSILSIQGYATEDHAHGLPSRSTIVTDATINFYFDESWVNSGTDIIKRGNTNDAGLPAPDYGTFKTYKQSVAGLGAAASETRPRNIAFNYIVRAA